jgi:hypothetical protein
VQVVGGTITTTFAYNGDGHRMRKVASGVTTTVVYTYNGDGARVDQAVSGR